jgi:hypothetical protein
MASPSVANMDIFSVGEQVLDADIEAALDAWSYCSFC